jgi:formaldehyde-activating enzyme involved in methanogenesis
LVSSESILGLFNRLMDAQWEKLFKDNYRAVKKALKRAAMRGVDDGRRPSPRARRRS